MNDPTIANNRDPLEGKIIFILIMTIVVQFLYPISTGNSLIEFLAYQGLYGLLFVAGIYLVSSDRRLMGLMIVAAVAWLIISTLAVFLPVIQWPTLLSYLLIIFFQVVLTYKLVEYVFRAKIVTRDVLLAAMTIYLLLGAIFVPIYGIIETLTWFPDMTMHAFRDGSGVYNIDGTNAHDLIAIPWTTLIYYSYATLTTLGYGDMVPLTDWARSASTFEAVVGVLYTAVVVARLVGLYAAQDVEAEIAK